jgi:hypothetical protein
MSNQISLNVILLVIIACGAYYISNKNHNQVIVIPSERGYRERGQPGGDDRYTMAPRPLRTEPGLPSIPSRGMPDAYQQMGILDGGDGKLLPLYGRRVAPRSDYFNYYTRTDTYNPVAVPIRIKKRDCQDSVGCPEVFSGDEIDTVTGMKAKVTLYGFDTPRYEP